jgi:ribosome maturation factor RimP
MASTRVQTQLAEVEGELAEVAAAAGCELVHAEIKGSTLRLFIDRPEGVTLADCERVSKQASALLDVVDFGTGRYVLEVSSPGLDRGLYRPADYRRFVGRLARVKLVDRETGKKRTVVARLAGFAPALDGRPEADGLVTLADERTGEQTEARLGEIVEARLEIEL